MIPYEWVSRRGEPVLGGWRLDSRQQRQLKALLIDIEKYDFEMAVGTLIFKKGGSTKKGAADIYYSKINGTHALRPRCCIGPELSGEEFRALRKAREKAKKEAPPESAMFPAGRAEVLTYLESVTKKDNRENPLMKDSKTGERQQDIQESRTRRQLVTLHKALGGRE
jgi:hypothetical protein